MARKENKPKKGSLKTKQSRNNHRKTQKPPARQAPQSQKETSSSANQQHAFAHWLYGRHCVAAALRNPKRRFHQLLVTRQGANWLLEQGLRDALIAAEAIDINPQELDAILPQGSVHQGVAAAVAPLSSPQLEDVLNDNDNNGRPIIVLDQVTDPQNIGAIFRAAAAFDACAIITQDRRTPPLAGPLAKASVGAIEIIPHIPVVNIARTLKTLSEHYFTCYGLAGEGALPLDQAGKPERLALVMGAEGSGLRPLVAKQCDALVTIPINQAIDSLNVATATAIALYALKK